MDGIIQSRAGKEGWSGQGLSIKLGARGLTSVFSMQRVSSVAEAHWCLEVGNITKRHVLVESPKCQT